MSKLTRQTMILFAGTSDSSSIGVFGSIAPGGGGATYSKVIATVQSLNAWGSGWKAEVVSPLRPAIQDFNAVDYVFSYGICYLHEMGIPEWDSGTVYYQNSYCQVAGTVYYSLQDNNTSNSPASSPTFWTAGILGIPAPDGTSIKNNAGVMSVGNTFGAWVAKSDGVTYQAATDGYICGYTNGLSGRVYNDTNPSPSILRWLILSAVTTSSGFNLPISKGEYWRTTDIAALYWKSTGS